MTRRIDTIGKRDAMVQELGTALKDNLLTRTQILEAAATCYAEGHSVPESLAVTFLNEYWDEIEELGEPIRGLLSECFESWRVANFFVERQSAARWMFTGNAAVLQACYSYHPSSFLEHQHIGTLLRAGIARDLLARTICTAIRADKANEDSWNAAKKFLADGHGEYRYVSNARLADGDPAHYEATEPGAWDLFTNIELVELLNECAAQRPNEMFQFRENLKYRLWPHEVAEVLDRAASHLKSLRLLKVDELLKLPLATRMAITENLTETSGLDGFKLVLENLQDKELSDSEAVAYLKQIRPLLDTFYVGALASRFPTRPRIGDRAARSHLIWWLASYVAWRLHQAGAVIGPIKEELTRKGYDYFLQGPDCEYMAERDERKKELRDGMTVIAIPNAHPTPLFHRHGHPVYVVGFIAPPTFWDIWVRKNAADRPRDDDRDDLDYRPPQLWGRPSGPR